MSKNTFFREGGTAGVGLAAALPSFVTSMQTAEEKLAADKLMFEAAELTKQQEEQVAAAQKAAPKPDEPEVIIFEAVKRKEQNAREDAFQAVVDWLKDSPTVSTFNDIAFELSGLDEIEPVDDAYPEEATNDYYRVLGDMADALVVLGADADDVTTLVNADEEDEAELQMASAAISDIVSAVNIDLEDDETVDDYAVVFAASENDDVMMEKMIRVVRAGKVVMKKKRIKPKRMNGKQKAALKKNRRKAWKGQARLKRKKSLKIGKKRGLHN